MKLALIIQTHFVALQTRALAEAFLERGHRVLISVDSESAFVEISDWFSNHDKCEVIRSAPVIWCGMSQVNMLVHCFTKLQAHADWDVALNISGSCVLFKPLKSLEIYLQDQVEQGIDLIFGSFVSKVQLANLQPEFTWVSSPWIRLEGYNHRVLNLIIPATTAAIWNDITLSPIVKSHNRIAYHSSEDLMSKTLTIRPLYPFEAKNKFDYFSHHPLHMGRAWYVLKRDAVDWLIKHGCSSRAWSMMKDSFEPDESIIHTVYKNEGQHFNVANTNLQLDYGRTGAISTVELLDLTLNQDLHPGRFFARKATLQADEANKLKDEIWLKC